MYWHMSGVPEVTACSNQQRKKKKKKRQRLAKTHCWCVYETAVISACKTAQTLRVLLRLGPSDHGNVKSVPQSLSFSELFL